MCVCVCVCVCACVCVCVPVGRHPHSLPCVGPEFTFTVSILNVSNLGVVASASFAGPQAYAGLTTNQFLLNVLNASSICRVRACGGACVWTERSDASLL